MRLLWRLSGARHAKAFDGGYGLAFDGRWNTIGHEVTYCSTSPSLCVLEKLVPVEDPALLPDLLMVTYEVPSGLAVESVRLEDLPANWRRHEAWTQQKGDEWHDAGAMPLLFVPSAIVPLAASTDLNLLINNRRPATAAIKMSRVEAFVFDPRLL